MAQGNALGKPVDQRLFSRHQEEKDKEPDDRMGDDARQKQESKDDAEATAVAGTVGEWAGQLNSTHAKSSVE